MMHRLHGLVGPVRVPEEYTPRALAVWWEGIAEQYGRYPCIATLLALPADREAIRYATEFGDELDVISQEHCLVIALSKAGVRRLVKSIRRQHVTRSAVSVLSAYSAIQRRHR